MTIKEEGLQTEVVEIIDLAEAHFEGEHEPERFKLLLVEQINELGPIGLNQIADILSQSRA